MHIYVPIEGLAGVDVAGCPNFGAATGFEFLACFEFSKQPKCRNRQRPGDVSVRPVLVFQAVCRLCECVQVDTSESSVINPVDKYSTGKSKRSHLSVTILLIFQGL